MAADARFWLGNRRLPLAQLGAHAGAQVTVAWSETGGVRTTHTVRVTDSRAGAAQDEGGGRVTTRSTPAWRRWPSPSWRRARERPPPRAAVPRRARRSSRSAAFRRRCTSTARRGKSRHRDQRRRGMGAPRAGRRRVPGRRGLSGRRLRREGLPLLLHLQERPAPGRGRAARLRGARRVRSAGRAPAARSWSASPRGRASRSSPRPRPRSSRASPASWPSGCRT